MKGLLGRAKNVIGGLGWAWTFLRPTMGAFWVAVTLMTVRTATQIIMPMYAGNSLDRVSSEDLTSELPQITGILGGLMLLAGALRFVYRYTSRVQDHAIANRLTVTLFRRVASASLTDTYGQTASYWQNRIQGDTRSLTSLYPHNLVLRLSSILRVGIFCVLLGMISLHLLVCLLIIAPLCAWLVLLIRRRIRRIQAVITELSAANSSWLANVIRGMPLVKLSGAEEREGDELERRCDVQYVEVRRAERLHALGGAAGAFIQRVVPLLVIFYAVILVSRGVISAGQLVSFTMYSSLMTASFNSAIRTGGKIEEALVSMERVKEVLAFPQENDSPARTRRLGGPIREVVLENVSFAYPPEDEGLAGFVRERLQDTDPPPGGPAAVGGVLRVVDLRLESGKPAILGGASGVGKSTIARLLCGFYRPSSGRILVNGIDLEELDLLEYRQKLNAISHEGYVLARSFSENARYRVIDANEEEVSRYVEALGLERAANRAARKGRRREMRIAQGLPELLPQELIPSGSPSLSGGERQRLLLLRQLLHDSSLWLLDEATSNLDAALESRVFDILFERGEFVMLAVSHRFSCIRRFGVVHVLRDGNLVASGSHEELFTECEAYRELVLPQVESTVATPTNGADASVLTPSRPNPGTSPQPGSPEVHSQ